MVGALALCGWIWDVESLKSIYGPITMKTNAAIGLLLGGVALMAVRRFPLVASICGLGAALVGGMTLLEHLSGTDLGIDERLFTEAPGAAATASPNRMGPNASLSLLLDGVSLLLLSRRDVQRVVRAQKLALATLLPASLAVAGSVYGARELYGVARYTGIALHTALAFIGLNIGILCARTEVGPAAVFVSPGPAGTLLRRLVLPLAVIPLLLGLLEIRGREAELFDRGLGIALLAVSLIVVLTTVLWHTATVIDRSDADRRLAEEERDRLFLLEREARAEAERASGLKDHFIATLSHELRTPLNVMLGWTRMLETGARPEDTGRAASVVARNGRLLARLVEDLLDISRVSVGQIQLARAAVKLDTIVQACVESIGPSAREARVQLTAGLDAATATIDADAERLQQIVWNLLSNAVKFTPPGGSVDVRTRATPDGVSLIVTDTGVGFDKEFAAQLFQPFRQADPTARREHGGLGLGLSIARYLAELHGGSLTGSSPGPGHGATFVLSLPSLGTAASAVSQAQAAV
jgi:signal transduction histidine kinase